MKIPHPKPKYRSELRIALGTQYYRIRRYLKWWFGEEKYASLGSAGDFPFEYRRHQSPLYRVLKDVEVVLQENKVTNLKIAVPKINGIILRPGETFSYWKCIGKPTKRKGYLPGMVLKSGTVAAATGGGLCQLSNMIYWLTVHTPLTVIERHRHGFDVFPDSNRTQPFGSGATCFYNYGDLMIRNDTAQSFKLVLEVGNEFLEGAWTCETAPEFRYEVYEKEHFMQSEFWGGYTRHNLIHRRKFAADSGAFLDDEYVVENHAVMMYSPFISEQKESL